MACGFRITDFSQCLKMLVLLQIKILVAAVSLQSAWVIIISEDLNGCF